MEKLDAKPGLGLLLTPHIGSLTIEYDPDIVSQSSLIEAIHEIEAVLPASVDFRIPSRTYKLPVVLDHPDMTECIQRYMDTTRNKAVYLPDNVEYLRKANALKERRDSIDMLVGSTSVVVAVGFLTGLPMLYALQPKAFLAQKYNPTRATTPGGTVGVGGALMALYPIEQPGGYMMMARTLELFDPYANKPGFSASKPWLFEPFDMVKFYEVSVEEYDRLFALYQAGQYHWQVEDGIFDVKASYEMFQAAKSDPDVIEYKKRQIEALEAQGELEKKIYDEWKEENKEEPIDEAFLSGLLHGANTTTVNSGMAANVWKMEVNEGDVLEAGQLVAILEAMKMEINVYAPEEAGGKKVKAIVKKPGAAVNAGDVLVAAE